MVLVVEQVDTVNLDLELLDREILDQEQIVKLVDTSLVEAEEERVDPQLSEGKLALAL